VRERVASLGGTAPVVRGAGGLGPVDPIAAAIGARIKAAFDPAGILVHG
jgi:hypothetical protein